MAEKLIFFVDDEPMFINLLEYTFKCRDGYVTKTFNTGEECLSHLSMNPDLIVVDYFLQGGGSQMTGLDVVRKIKEVTPNVPIVILSGNDNEETIQESKDAGVQKYIVKDGYFIDNLVDCISEILPVQ